jgi:hypothetical protein
MIELNRRWILREVRQPGRVRKQVCRDEPVRHQRERVVS